MGLHKLRTRSSGGVPKSPFSRSIGATEPVFEFGGGLVGIQRDSIAASCDLNALAAVCNQPCEQFSA